MDERDLRGLLDRVKAGRMSRRAFAKRLMAVGLTAPLANQLLAYSGVAMAQSKPTYKPTKRGGGGLLKVLWWQGPTLLNPHFAVGTKDQDGSRLFYEPLAGWDGDGNLRPVLAEAIPGREVVGWFQGRMELGPRTPSNRSIVCDPRPADMKDILNLKIKQRER